MGREVFLSADEIHAEVASGRLVIDPFVPDLLKPASYTLRLSKDWLELLQLEEPVEVSAPEANHSGMYRSMQGNELVVNPSTLVLGGTLERISLPDDLLGIISTLSHLARFGLSANLNSFLVNPGFGQNRSTALTLEILSFNPSPLRLSAGMPICHLSFVRVSSSKNYGRAQYPSIYEGRAAPSAPLFYEELRSIYEVSVGKSNE